MDINDYRTKYTREEFIEEASKTYSNILKKQMLCPYRYNLIQERGKDCCIWSLRCKKCWTNAVKDIQFKGEEDDIIEESKDKYEWIFNISQFKNDNILIACHTKDEAEKFINILITNGINTWNDEDELNPSNTYYDWCEGIICYEFDTSNGLFYSDIDEYKKDKKIDYKIYDFDIVDFSQIWNKKSIDKVALHNQNEDFDITKVKYITKEQLQQRGYKTGDTLFDGTSMAIVYGNKVLHINDNCVETLDIRAFDYILPIELIESDSEIQRLLSGKLSRKISQAYIIDYFIKIEEPPKLKTICSIKFTSDTSTTKEFILEEIGNPIIKIGYMMECFTGGSYQYGRIVDITNKKLSEHEIETYRTCRNLSL